MSRTPMFGGSRPTGNQKNVTCTVSRGGTAKTREDVPHADRQMHRIASVRAREGTSLRGISRKHGVEVRELKKQEVETTDLRLSQLYLWQRALQVPLNDLLIDHDAPLSEPVMKRAQMIKLMKTVGSLLEHAKDERTRRLATMLVEQLIEVMPELEGVSAWPTVGQRRTTDDYGSAASRCIGGLASIESMLG